MSYIDERYFKVPTYDQPDNYIPFTTEENVYEYNDLKNGSMSMLEYLNNVTESKDYYNGEIVDLYLYARSNYPWYSYCTAAG